MTPAELLHFAATHDYSKVNETMRVIMDAATEIERGGFDSDDLEAEA